MENFFRDNVNKNPLGYRPDMLQYRDMGLNVTGSENQASYLQEQPPNCLYT